MSVLEPQSAPSYDDVRDAALEVTRDQAVAALWQSGVLLWKVRDHQLTVYEFLAAADGHDFTQRLVYVHRQFGKSFLSLLVAVELALSKKGARISVVAPTQKMLRAVLLPNMTALLEDCPEALRPTFTALDNVFTFPSTGATIRLDGADAGNAENLRGRANDFVIIDEAGFVKDLKSLIKDIVLPSFLTTGGRLLCITTPPKTAGHYCAELRQKLSRVGAFLKFRLSDNTSVTAEVRKRWADECGGEDSPTFRREYECEEITDGDLAVVPEFDEKAQRDIVQPVPAPDPYVARVVGCDLGWTDPTGLLFGYYDFQRARVCIQDEVLLRKARIEEIAQAVKRKEGGLWGTLRPYARISDVDPMVLAELAAAHALTFRPVSKVYGKEQMVNEVRTWVRQRRILIDPRCTQLIAQLEAAIWTSSRKSFDHTEAFGHFDLVDALVYLLQALPLHVNPYPLMPAGVSPDTHYIAPGAFQAEQPLKDLFRSPWRRR